jgi:integral membrane sensor domain MASE1
MSMSLNTNLEEFFKALKTNVSRKIFPITFILVLPVLFASVRLEQAFPGLIMGA